MAQSNKPQTPAVGHKEILAEINLISQIQQIETKLAIQPTSMRFAQLADAYLSMGQYEDGIRICEDGLQHFPHYATAYLVLARGYYLSGNKAKAQTVLDGFLHSHPAHLTARKMLADMALEGDDIKTAVSHYRVALRLDPLNRQIIQTLVDLKDQYQKLKGGQAGEEEEEELVRPREPRRVKPAVPPPVETPAETETPTASEAAAANTADAKKSLTEEIEQVEDTFVESLQPEPVRAEEVAPLPKKERPEDQILTPAFVDDKGILYFYADEELSFEQFKLRSDLQRDGKAVIVDRSVLDAQIEALKKSAAEKIRETAEKTPAAEKEPSIEDAGLEAAQTSAVTEEAVFTREEQETVLSEIEISYKDYLDIVTSEEELLEAIFTDEEEAAEAVEEIGIPEILDKDRPERRDRDLSYAEYVDSLDDDGLIAEATFGEEPGWTLEQYAAYLDDSEEAIDFETFAVLHGGDGLWPDTPAVTSAEPVLSYRDYLSGPLSEQERTAATLTAPASTVTESVQPQPQPVVTEQPAARTHEETLPHGMEEEAEDEEINPNEISLDLVEKFASRGQFGTAYKVCRMLKLKNPTDAKIDRKILELKRLYVWSSQLVG